MKTIKYFTLLTFCLFIFMKLSLAQNNDAKPLKSVITQSLDLALGQYSRLLTSLELMTKIEQPKTIDNDGKLILVKNEEWTVGFFPGSLWYLYEYNKNKVLQKNAVKFTEALKDIQYYTGNHDVGFMMNCSYGNGYRLMGNKSYKSILIQTAKSLCKRYRPIVGSIQSWSSSEKWECPVIVDNMMNLELLFKAWDLSGDPSFYNIAVKHAETTLKNHYRKDYSCYHVVDYDTITGAIKTKVTAQGYSDESTWARGQSWGLYGFTMCYRFTKRQEFLDQAIHIAAFLLSHPNLPEDYIPYWDYNAPNIPNEERDASSAAIMASALLELSTYPGVDKNKYLSAAEKIIRSLSSEKYLAKKNENGNFLLMHSVGSKPANREVDVPLNYADYYYLETLLRARKILN
jgi:hypothetical protein